METPHSSLYLYDTTLRDGSQRRGISYSVADKLKITRLLDEFGFAYIEGGWPGSNPKDAEYFKRVREHSCANARLVAFGSTRKKGIEAKEDSNLNALLSAETPAVALVGKSWRLHVEKVLGVSESENRAMIFESVSLMKQEGREVVFDAEHFFDGYHDSPEHALSVLMSALEGGADWLVLCDTNGGNLPETVERIVHDVRRRLGSRVKIGIHTHNDCELAVANALAAVRAGATQIQGTVNGYGERCGNCNLVSLVPTLQLKLGCDFSYPLELQQLASLSRKVSDIANVTHDSQSAYVGSAAFAHKGGIHVAAVEKVAHSYEHIDPRLVGNSREIVISELSGKGNIRLATKSLGDVKADSVLQKVKDLEAQGLQFENAEGSFKLVVKRDSTDYLSPFRLKDLMVVSDERDASGASIQAILKMEVGGDVIHTAADGSGPVHAIDQCMRKALRSRFSEVDTVKLVDYKVRILDPESATAAQVRVNIEAEAMGHRWTTVGCDQNIIRASTAALLDSFEYFVTYVVRTEEETAELSAV